MPSETWVDLFLGQEINGLDSPKAVLTTHAYNNRCGPHSPCFPGPTFHLMELSQQLQGWVGGKGVEKMVTAIWKLERIGKKDGNIKLSEISFYHTIIYINSPL